MLSRISLTAVFLAISPIYALAGEGLLALVAVQPGASPNPATAHVIQNMPPATSQQGLGLCYSHSAAAVYNYYQCQALKEDCSQVSGGDLASPFDLARFGHKPEGDVDSVSSYGEIDEGGDALYTLETAALMVGSVASQACISEEKIFKDKYVANGMISTSDVKAQRAVLESLKGSTVSTNSSRINAATLIVKLSTRLQRLSSKVSIPPKKMPGLSVGHLLSPALEHFLPGLLFRQSACVPVDVFILSTRTIWLSRCCRMPRNSETIPPHLVH